MRPPALSVIAASVDATGGRGRLEEIGYIAIDCSAAKLSGAAEPFLQPRACPTKAPHPRARGKERGTEQGEGPDP
jgi:hypothetical protein